MKESSVTIAIPYYTGLEYLRQAVQSVLAQDMNGWRLVVCDDSPVDDPRCEALIHDIGDKRISYSANPARLGIPGNWNRCLELATTEYVTILHADDALLPDYLRTMLSAAGQFPDAVAFACPAMVMDHQGQVRLSLKRLVKAMHAPRGSAPVALTGETALHGLLSANIIVCPSLLYRTGYARACRFDTRWKHVADLAWTTGALLDNQSIVYVPRPVFAHRDHSGSATTTNSRSLIRFEELVRLYQELQAVCLARGWHRAARTAGRMTMIKKTLLFCAIEDMMSLRWKQALQKVAAGRSLFSPPGTL